MRSGSQQSSSSTALCIITSMRRSSCFGARCEHSSTCGRLVDRIRVSSHVAPIHDRCTSSQILVTFPNGKRPEMGRVRDERFSNEIATTRDRASASHIERLRSYKTHAQCSLFRSYTLIHDPLYVNRKFQSSNLEIETPITKRLSWVRFRILTTSN